MKQLMWMARVMALVAGVATAAAAQTPGAAIDGRVVDARTGQPLPRALIRIEGGPAPVETAADGGFRLTVAPGTHTLVVSLIGYAEIRREIAVAANATHTLAIELSEGAGQYEERVTVTGSAGSEADRAPAGAVLHGRDLQALRGVMLDDPLRAVQSLPSATSTDDFYSEFAVRGSPFRQLGLVVDGVPAPYLIHSIHATTDGGSIAMVNGEALGAAALLPGSYPQRTGRRLGAEIDLSTRDGGRDAFHARAGLSGTSANLIAEGPLAKGRGSWIASVRRSYLDYLLERIDPEGTFGFGFSDALAKLTFDISPRQQVQALGVLGRSLFDEGPEGLGANDDALSKSGAHLASVTWRVTPSPRASLFQRVYLTGMDFNNVNNRDVMLDRGRDRVLGWREDITFALGDRWHAEFGGDAQHITHALAEQRTFDGAAAPTVLADYRASTWAAAAYAQLSARFGKVSFSPGARVDYWPASRQTAASPWLTGVWSLASSTRLRAGVGLYRQFPELSYLHGRRGNPDLTDERARHSDVTLSHTFGSAVEVQVTGFARHEQNVLRALGAEARRVDARTIALGRGDVKWENRLQGHARGVEAVLRRDSADGLSGWIAYAYSRHRYEDAAAGEQFFSDHDQRHTFSTFVNWRLSNRTSLGGKFRYGSNYPITGYLGQERGPQLFGGDTLFLALVTERNTLRLPAYARLDVRADRAMTIGGRRVTFFAEVVNALDRSNQRNVPYSIQRNGRVSGATDSLLPIVPSAGFVVEF